MSNIYSTIYLLNSYSQLSSLNGMFSRQHRELLYHVDRDREQVSRMSDSEKYFIYSWVDIGSIEEIVVPKLTMPGLNEETSEEIIRFQKVIVNVEYPKRRKKDNDGHFLPKVERVNNVDVELIFFELDNKVYTLINTSNEYNISRVKTLIGEQNISGTSLDYLLETDIFNWLFYVFDEREGVLDEELKLENISGFMGNVSDDANVFTGTSSQTTELIVTKAFISNGGVLKNITLRVRDNNADITCMVNENSKSVIYGNISSKLRILDSIEEPIFLLLYLYGFILLKLKALYILESDQFMNEDNPRFSKKIGIDVIESIVEKNNIQLHEIEPFFQKNFQSQEIN